MAYRNGTYVAFHANGTSDPTESDIKYYNTLKMWKVRDEADFKFVNSHEKRAVRDSSTKEALKRALMERMKNSKHLLLIVGQTTRFDTDWVPFEISYAVDNCEIPIIVAYPGYDRIMDPGALSALWPKALADRINNGTAKAIHVPFKKEPIADAVLQFDFDTPPKGSLVYYSKDAYLSWGHVF
jgi:hypothetical protein